MTDRRTFLALTGLAAAGMIVPRGLLAWTPPAKIPMTVYKSPTCGCCHAWVDYVTANGFAPTVIDVADQERLNEIKTTSGVPPEVRSCHMALVGDYAVEGHVPVDLIQKMLREKPQGRGLAVPGMIMGSPGMEVAGVPPRHYDVLLFQRDGSTRVYASK